MADTAITTLINLPSDQVVTTPTTAKTLTSGLLVKAGALNTLSSVNVTTVVDTYTVLPTDSTIICNKATPFTVTLPTAVVGQVFDIGNIGAGAVTIDGAGTDTIDGDLTQYLLQWESVKLQCVATNTWKVQ